MAFGLSSKMRFLCIDITFDEVYFVVVRKTGHFFQIDFTERVYIQEGVFEESRIRVPGKIRDVLELIHKKFGVLPVIANTPESFCYAALLPSETYASSQQLQHQVRARVTTPSYTWMNMFQKGTSSYMAVHAAEKEICNVLYTLIKSVGFDTVVMYPRALALTELSTVSSGLVCDCNTQRTTLVSTYHTHAVGFSLVPYGTNLLHGKLQKRFHLNNDEIQEVLTAYGTDVLPRKEGHLVHGMVHTFLSPIVDEIRSLTLRQGEYNLPPIEKILVTGAIAQCEGVLEDLSRITKIPVATVDVWQGLIDFNTYIPSIHKDESHKYAGIAGLMNILKNGTLYQPFDLE